MADLLDLIRRHQELLEHLGLLSLILFVVTVIAFPLVIVFLPKDYFVRADRDPAHHQRTYPVLWWGLAILKNILGFLLVVAGLAMLVLPGQGLLSILLGITLMNFPGKYSLERWLVSHRTIADTLNRIRERAGRSRLELPEETPAQQKKR